jgi:hypothetical protein
MKEGAYVTAVNPNRNPRVEELMWEIFTCRGRWDERQMRVLGAWVSVPICNVPAKKNIAMQENRVSPDST